MIQIFASTLLLLPWLPCGSDPALGRRTDAPDDLEEYEDALRKIGRLGDGPRAELLAEIERAIAATGADQVQLVAEFLAEHPVDRESLPEETEFGYHDPSVWLGGPARRTVRSNTSKWKDVAEGIAVPWEPRDLETRYVYEFGSGKVVRRKEAERDDELVFRNLLRGFPPDQDLAEAVLLSQLDASGELRKEAEFFSHEYADLDAKAYEGITLYDVWSRAIPVDVPDVDVRAYAAKVYADKSLPVPLRDPEKRTWYPRMAESIGKLKARVRAARALAGTWFQGKPKLEAGYSDSVDILHATLMLEKESVASVRARFERDGDRFLEVALADLRAEGSKAWGPGNSRRDRLVAGREKIRAAVLEVLRARELL